MFCTLKWNIVVGNIFRLETCMNGLVKVPPYSKLNFQGGNFFTQNFYKLWTVKHIYFVLNYLYFTIISWKLRNRFFWFNMTVIDFGSGSVAHGQWKLIHFFSELNRKDPELDKVINIGFPMPKMDRAERRKRGNVLKKFRSDTETKTELEKAARQRTCKLVFSNSVQCFTI
jgi:hypothetical protein